MFIYSDIISFNDLIAITVRCDLSACGGKSAIAEVCLHNVVTKTTVAVRLLEAKPKTEPFRPSSTTSPSIFGFQQLLLNS